MATIKITSKDDNLFIFQVGKIRREEPRNYHAKQTSGGEIRAELVADEQSDLFNPIHFSQIEVDGVVFDNANDCVTALNNVIYNDVSGTGDLESKLEEIKAINQGIKGKLEADCSAPINVKVCNQINLESVQNSLDAILQNQTTVINVLNNLEVLEQQQLEELQNNGASLEALDLHVITNTTEIKQALSDLQEIESNQTTELSNKLTEVIGKLNDVQETVQSDNQDLKEELDNVITMLQNENDKLLELIVFAKPNTVVITIPEAIPLVFNPLKSEEVIDIYEHNGSHIVTEKGIKFNGYSTMYFKQKLPINHNIKYLFSAIFEGKDGKLTGGQVSYDDNHSVAIKTDKAQYNHMNCSIGYNQIINGEYRVSNIIESYNATEGTDVTKFDPIATKFRAGFVINQNHSSGELTVKKVIIKPIEGTFKVEKGSVTYFFDKEGKEVLAKRIFRKNGAEISEPQFWYEGDYINVTESGMGDVEERLILEEETKTFRAYKSLTHTNISGTHSVIEEGHTITYPIAGKIDGDTVTGNITNITTIDATNGKVYITVVY